VLIGIAGYLANAGWLFAFGLLAFAAHLAWQVRSLDISDPALCLPTIQIQSRRRTDPVRGDDPGCGVLAEHDLVRKPVPRFSRSCSNFLHDLVFATMYARVINAAARLAAHEDRRPPAPERRTATTARLRIVDGDGAKTRERARAVHRRFRRPIAGARARAQAFQIAVTLSLSQAA